MMNKKSNSFKDTFDTWYSKNNILIERTLFSYLSIKTVSPHEYLASDFLEVYLSSIGIDVTRSYFDNQKLLNNSKFTDHPQIDSSMKRFNIHGELHKGETDIKLPTVLFNCHIDVVPDVSEEQRQFQPYSDEEYIFGRGACDTKSNIICLVEAIRFLQESNIPIKKNISIDLVIEEETTGNGTLVQTINGVNADFVVVFEPTSLMVYKGHRGVLTVNLRLQGSPSHMGHNSDIKNVHNQLKDILIDIENLEEYLQNLCMNNNNFKKSDNTVKINIGKIDGGEWPGSIPSKCDILFNIGFTDELTIQQVEELVQNHFEKYSNVEVTFPELKNQPYIIDENNIYLKEFFDSIQLYGKVQKGIFGWRVSCDAHYYFKNCNIPTVIFGCGKLSDAHSNKECVSKEEIKKEILILANYLSM